MDPGALTSNHPALTPLRAQKPQGLLGGHLLLKGWTDVDGNGKIESRERKTGGRRREEKKGGEREATRKGGLDVTN